LHTDIRKIISVVERQC